MEDLTEPVGETGAPTPPAAPAEGTTPPPSPEHQPSAPAGAGVTGPLAPLFAQVLEEHELGLQAEWWGFSERVEARRRFDAALSSIERHVQDMEKALGCDHHETAWTFIEYEGESWNACQDCGLLERWAGGQRFAQRVDPAALPASETPQAAAREKEEE